MEGNDPDALALYTPFQIQRGKEIKVRHPPLGTYCRLQPASCLRVDHVLCQRPQALNGWPGGFCCQAELQIIASEVKRKMKGYEDDRDLIVSKAEAEARVIEERARPQKLDYLSSLDLQHVCVDHPHTVER